MYISGEKHGRFLRWFSQGQEGFGFVGIEMVPSENEKMDSVKAVQSLNPVDASQ